MTNITRVPVTVPLSNDSSSDTKSTKKIKDAAQQFEGLMIQQLLKSARGGSESRGWLSTGEEDQTGQTAIDFAEQQFSSVLAKSGGLGLTNFIVKNIEKK